MVRRREYLLRLAIALAFAVFLALSAPIEIRLSTEAAGKTPSIPVLNVTAIPVTEVATGIAPQPTQTQVPIEKNDTNVSEGGVNEDTRPHLPAFIRQLLQLLEVLSDFIEFLKSAFYLEIPDIESERRGQEELVINPLIPVVLLVSLIALITAVYFRLYHRGYSIRVPRRGARRVGGMTATRQEPLSIPEGDLLLRGVKLVEYLLLTRGELSKAPSLTHREILKFSRILEGVLGGSTLDTLRKLMGLYELRRFRNSRVRVSEDVVKLVKNLEKQVS